MVTTITDGDVVQRLIHPAVFNKLNLSAVGIDGANLVVTDVRGASFTVMPSVTRQGGIETREFHFPSGRMTIQRDGLELLTEAFQRPAGTPGQEPERKVLRCALRDRQLDGTDRASPLSAFPNTHEATNRLPHPDFKAAELSIYCYDPERYLPAGEMLHFIMNVDEYIYKRFEPLEFFRLWTRAFAASNMAPWQPAPPLKGVAQHFVETAGLVLTEKGYNRMDAVCGFYNVAMFFIERMQFAFTYGEHEAAFRALQSGLKQLDERVGRQLNLREQAWVVALQNIPAAFIPEQMRLGSRWINSPTYTSYVCRLHKELVPFGRDPRLDKISLPDAFAAGKTAASSGSSATGAAGLALPPAPKPVPPGKA